MNRINTKGKGGGSQDNLLSNEVPMATSDNLPTYHTMDGLGAQTPEEKRFLLLVERGDVASIKRYLINVY
jgi:hypothetical protein